MKITLSALAAIVFLMLFMIVPSLAAEGVNEVEPNDTVDTADSVTGFTIQGSIGKNDTDDWFMLDGQEGEMPSFVIVFDVETMEVDWEIYSDDEVVASGEEDGSPETISDVDVPGTCYIHVSRVSGKGDYTILISNPDCQGDDEVEPNDEYDLADDVTDIGSKINGWACENDNDWYLVRDLGDDVDFTITFNADEVEVDWEIYDDTDTQVAEGTEWGSPETLNADIDGDCWIHVWWYSGAGEYAIKIKE
jgi:hypothetical protein